MTLHDEEQTPLRVFNSIYSNFVTLNNNVKEYYTSFILKINEYISTKPLSDNLVTELKISVDNFFKDKIIKAMNKFTSEVIELITNQIISKYINRQNYYISFDINDDPEFSDKKLIFDYSSKIIYLAIIKKLKSNSYEEVFIEYNRLNSMLHIGYKVNNKYTSNRLLKADKNLYLFNYNLNSLTDDLNTIIDNDKQHFFIGNYKLGKVHGKGIESKIFNNISNLDNNSYDLYIGEYKENKFDGQGLLNCLNYIYNGTFNKGIKDGKCELLIKNKQHKYIGDIKNNILNGIGEYEFNNGNIYKGEIHNNLANGKGIIHYKDDEKYIGKFEKQKKVGEGKYITKDGYELISYFEKGDDIKEKNIYKY